MHQSLGSALTAKPSLSPLSALRQVRRVVLVGSFPPRRCGIASFTADVHQALKTASPGLECGVVAMTDEGDGHAYGEDVMVQVRQNRPADYLEAARRINAAGPDVVCVQHEFGLFGGPAGETLMLMLDAVRAPVVTTLHTIIRSRTPTSAASWAG